MRCADCKYFSAKWSSLSALKPRDGVGECRKNAPRGPVALAWLERDEVRNTAILSAFPMVPFDDWCGEFHRKEAA